MLDLLIHNATLPDGRRQMAVAVQDGASLRDSEGACPLPSFLDLPEPLSDTTLADHGGSIENRLLVER